MFLKEQHKIFETEKNIYNSAILSFEGVEGFDVYNPSIPFEWEGKRLIYGRVERRNEWARSFVRLFEHCSSDHWRLVPNTMIYQMEDPFVSIIGGEIVLGGTHVRYNKGKYSSFSTYFYKGTDFNDLYYFTSGPVGMKDVRLVQLEDQKIGVFSRPRGEIALRKTGIDCMIGFTIIDSLEDLDESVIEEASPINGLFMAGEWGGCNQAYLLDNGFIGVIGHKSYRTIEPDGTEIAHYVNISFVLDPVRREAEDVKIIGTRSCYPAGPHKRHRLSDCCFSSGIVVRPDGKADLYSGIGDCQSGRITIENPFAKYGKILL